MAGERRNVVVLVCGGRNYADWRQLSDALRKLHDEVTIRKIICGCATGADDLAGKWAHLAGIPAHCFHADWETHGRAAGPIRNQRMLDEGKPDLVVAFKGRRGTADMMQRAKAAGVQVLLGDW